MRVSQYVRILLKTSFYIWKKTHWSDWIICGMTTKWALRLSYYIYKEFHIDLTNVTSLVPKIFFWMRIVKILIYTGVSEKKCISACCMLFCLKLYLQVERKQPNLLKIGRGTDMFTDVWETPECNCGRGRHYPNQIMAANYNKEMAESLCSVCEVEETANVFADSLVIRQLVLWAVIVLLAATCVSKGHSFNWRVFGNEETFILDYNLHHKIRCQTCPRVTILFLGHYNVHRIVKASGLQWRSVMI